MSIPSSAGLGFAPPGRSDSFSLGLDEHDAPDSVGPSPSTKRVLLRRPLRDQDQPDSDQKSVKSGKSALLAHRIRPGKSIQLKNSPSRATLPEKNDLLQVAQPESVTQGGAKGPRYASSTGKLLSYSLLGNPIEYEAMVSAVHGLPPPSGDPGGSFAPSASAGALTPHQKLEAIQAREEQQMQKLTQGQAVVYKTLACGLQVKVVTEPAVLQ